MSLIHLSLNLSEYGRHSGAWRHPAADVTAIPNLAAYVHAVQWAEKGFFDQAFLADSPVHAPGRTSVTGTRVDPLEMASRLMAVTDHIGVIATLSTSYNEPFDVARRAASVASLSGGRLGVNYVASTGAAIARNFNRSDQLPHDQRYARAHEFLEVVTRLWAGAPTVDAPGTPISHHGRFFDVEGVLDVQRPPLGRPVIIQAGSSPDGRDQAARWADAIYAGGSSLEAGQEYYADIKKRTADYGRDPESVKVMLGLAPFLAPTDEEGEQLKTLLDDFHAKGADTIGHLSGLLEIDLKAYDAEGPLPFDDLPEVKAASVSQAGLFARMAREGDLTISQTAYLSYVGGLANMQFVESGTAERVADTMQEWFEAGTCDGYSLVAPNIGHTIESFVTGVVPILQERGLARTSYESTSLAGHFGLSELDDRASAWAVA
ncbi:NtaA/DmoA family FMN-dependent monooxygenase [Nocardioides bruguierae]|uniref:NtaA/DmoA family FMN-dependent monooxygenase n=1 Tax=Nocardioides bruguierae TaxID=2945102 RepID=A0A9X2DAN1_9ACTN|nr:NtaA/DmoA family FMN-dependent monooxygenase [Nocardioides bruguierae]MCM0621134.1 NtaA/DmoA family FMN-dependent monooxygenase [Nocardioides bruguierae]